MMLSAALRGAHRAYPKHVSRVFRPRLFTNYLDDAEKAGLKAGTDLARFKDLPDSGQFESMSKIVCTVGPSSETQGVIQKLVTAGMRCMRINFSHATYEDALQRMFNLRSCKGDCSDVNYRAVLLDTQGPEIRTGSFPSKGAIQVRIGQKFDITTDPSLANEQTEDLLYVNYTSLATTVNVGDPILLDDGLIKLEVTSIDEDGQLTARVMNDGKLGSRKGVNLPGAIVDLPALTEKDKQDIRWGIEHDVDYIAASFVRKAEDALAIRAYMDECHQNAIAKNGWPADYPRTRLISKIENGEALDNFADILAESDGIMVARGDLGVEIPFQNVTPVQKSIVRACNMAGKPVIVATQMLESMTKNPRPTRAEASDVANAIEDGADAVMLSGETANGSYPVPAVEAMRSIVQQADRNMASRMIDMTTAFSPGQFVGNEHHAMAQAAVSLAHAVNAKLIIVVANSGSTARMVSRYRPEAPIVTLCNTVKVARQLQLYKGVLSMLDNQSQTSDFSERPNLAVTRAKERGWVNSGETVVMVWASALSKELGKVTSVHVATVA